MKTLILINLSFRLFPLRLILRLGALYRYYPTPILSNINREPVFAEIGKSI